MTIAAGISLHDVTVARGGHIVLRNVSFTLPPGSITAVAGPSGAGKSSLLGVVIGALSPVTGTVAASGPIVFFSQTQSWTAAAVADRVRGVAPRVVVLDEPTVVLSPAESVLLIDALHNLARRGVTVLFASHDAAFSRMVATNALVVENGAVTSQPTNAVDYLAIQEATLATLRAR